MHTQDDHIEYGRFAILLDTFQSLSIVKYNAIEEATKYFKITTNLFLVNFSSQGNVSSSDPKDPAIKKIE